MSQTEAQLNIYVRWGKGSVMEEPGKGSTIADRLQYLVNVRSESRGGPWSDVEIAEGIEKQGLGSISAQTVRRLRIGETDDPKIGTLASLAKFFGVETSYFTDDDPAASMNELRYLLALRDGTMRHHLMRAGELSDDNQDIVGGLIANLLAVERKHNRQAAGDTDGGKGTSAG